MRAAWLAPLLAASDARAREDLRELGRLHRALEVVAGGGADRPRSPFYEEFRRSPQSVLHGIYCSRF